MLLVINNLYNHIKLNNIDDVVIDIYHYIAILFKAILNNQTLARFFIL